MLNQSEPMIAQPRNRLKWGLGCAGIGMVLISGAVLIGLIVTPLIFRGLSQETQDKIVRHLPFMRAFQPTRAYAADVLPTVAVTAANALALLATDLPTDVPPTIVPSSTSPSIAVPTLVPTATNTPNPTATATLKSKKSPTHTPTTAVSAFGGGQSVNQTTSRPTVVPSPTAAATIIPTIVPVNTAIPPTALPTNTQPAPSPVIAQAATLVPSPTVPTPRPSITPYPIPEKVRLAGLHWEPQGWNNCGPANLVQVLRYYGWIGTQAQIAAALKPNKNDKNVSPWEMVRYVNLVSKPKLKALNRAAGDLTLIKRLVAAKFAVITESGFYDPDNPSEGWIGHYLTITAYDDAAGVLTRLDTFKNEHSDKYEVFDGLWQNFNRQYIVIYPPEREAEVAAILGPDMDLHYNAQHSLDLARTETNANKNDPFAWFNLGTSFTLLGQYAQAATAYDQAFNVGGGLLPYRVIWYQFWPFEAYYKAGRYSDVLRLVNANLATTIDVEESYYWRGMVEAASRDTRDMQRAIDDFNQTLSLNPYFTPASDALTQVQNGTFKAPAISNG